MTKRLLLIGILSASALLGACKKKDAATGAGSGSDIGSAVTAMMGSAAAMSGSAAAAVAGGAPGGAMAGSAVMAGSAAAPAGAAIADKAAYMTKAEALAAKFAEIAKETDCGKLGAALSTEADADKATMAALEAYEKAHPDDKKAFEDAHKADMEKSMGSVMKCQNDPAVKAAMAKMPG